MSRRLAAAVLFVVSAVLLPAAASAQLVRSYGVKAGVTSSHVRYSKLEIDEVASFVTERRTGFAVLAFMEWLDFAPFSLVTEAGYVQRGFVNVIDFGNFENAPDDGTRRFGKRFDYFSTAALAKLRLPNTSFAPYALAGPRLDFFLGGDPDGEATFANSYSNTAFGVTVGAGLEVVELLPVTLFAEARYNVDVTNSLPDVPRDMYNNAFDLVVGVQIPEM